MDKRLQTWRLLYQLLLTFVPYIHCSMNHTYPAEVRLREDLLRNYDRLIRPVLDFRTPLNVTYGAALYQLVGINIKLETVTLLLWQRISWYDELLRWNPEDYNGIEIIRFLQTDIWVPDILPYNDVGVYDPTEYRLIIPVSVRSDGFVKWLNPQTTETTCALDVTDFPFDQQRCKISIGSWQHTLREIDIYCSDAELDISAYNKHGLWELAGENFL